jgi:hypothetical protein
MMPGDRQFAHWRRYQCVSHLLSRQFDSRIQAGYRSSRICRLRCSEDDLTTLGNRIEDRHETLVDVEELLAIRHRIEEDESRGFAILDDSQRSSERSLFGNQKRP